jgi:hypothetical protein
MIVEIRLLQNRAAEMEVARAGRGRETAAETLVRAEQSLARAQGGWTNALEGAFDPGLARHWSAEVNRNGADEREADETLREADRQLEEKREDWYAAEACSDVARDGHYRALHAAARRREEARLAEAEDRFGGQWGPR